MSLEIKKFNELIEPVLRNGQKFISYECKNLLSSGENYGSVMLQVDVTILNEDGRNEIIHCVAKTCPPRGLTWEIFATEITFKTEITLYEEMVPALSEFAKGKGCGSLNFFAKCLGARISAIPNSNDVDEDAVILLENLKMQGYELGDRFVGFDKETTMLLLKNLATLHATTIAYKRAKPEEFRTKIQSHLNRRFIMKLPDKTLAEVINFATNCVMKNQKCVPHSFQIKNALLNLCNQSYLSKRNELFTTLVHHDLWTNNTMVKFENGKPIENKMVDFQIIDFDSLAHDVTFLMYSSVELSVLEHHIDELYKFYYKKFAETLVKLQCDISEYSFESVMEECGIIAKEAQFGHLIFLLVPIMKLKGKAQNINEGFGELCQENTIHENYAKRIQFILLDLVKRKWI